MFESMEIRVEQSKLLLWEKTKFTVKRTRSTSSNGFMSTPGPESVERPSRRLITPSQALTLIFGVLVRLLSVRLPVDSFLEFGWALIQSLFAMLF